MRIRALSPMLLAACAPDPQTSSAVPSRECNVQAVFEGEASTVEVAGRFNNWEPQALARSADVWTRDLGELQPGTYAYKFVIDGIWETPPPEVYTVWEGGFENRALVVGDCELPTLETVSGAATSAGDLTAEFRFVAGANGDPLDVDQVTVTVGGTEVDHVSDASTGKILVAVSDLLPGKHSVRVSARDTGGQTPESGDAYLPLWVEPRAFQWQDGLMYYLFLDRFADGGESGFPSTEGSEYGTDWMGGDLVGAKQKLESGYFEDLGVRTIWLSPLNENPEGAFIGNGGHYYTGYHGYWPTEPRQVEQRLGTTEVDSDTALREFIDLAHDRGIRVLLDVVLNHVHEEHTYLDEHPEWFTAEPCICTTDPGECNWDTNPLGCWFTDYLPDLDYRNPEIVNQLTNDLIWWTDTYDIDGFRVDAAKHMDHVILRTLSMRLRDRYETSGGAPFYLVGETFTGQGGQSLISDYVAPYELDGQFEFPLLYPIRNVFGHDQSFHVLADEVELSDSVYGDSVQFMSPFLGNHDVARFATDITGCDNPLLFEGCSDVLENNTSGSADLEDRLALAFAFVLTQPGVPLVYYGDEIGLAGAGDPDNRRLMPWQWSDSQAELHDRIATIAGWRTELESLKTGDRQTLTVGDDVYAYARQSPSGEVAIVVLHKGDEETDITVPVPIHLDVEGATLRALDGGSAFVDEGQLTLHLQPWEARVLTNE